jgi:DEAD/DEAH box helicase domain-containing protein
MLPSLLARQVRIGVEDQLRASFAPSTKSFEHIIDRFIAEPEALLKGPWLSLEMPFRRSRRGTEFFADIPLGFRPYRHQEIAFERFAGDQPKSGIVATGTGSGKTECFLLPILDACIKAKGQPGVKAIIIYPMNALAGDQARRLARMIAGNDRLTSIRVGLYADEAPKSPVSMMTQTEVINSRDALVRDPPDILLTNYKMLDYMLIRPNEREIWEKNRPETLRYLVVDELHTFDGAQGTDLASLIRRLKARLKMVRGNLCCVGTSATLGGEDAAPSLLAYAAQIFDEDFDPKSIIVEDRKSVAEYLEDLPVNSISMPAASNIISLMQGLEGISPGEFLSRAYRLWFEGEPPANLDEMGARVDLGKLLDGHLFLQALLRVLKGRPTPYSEIRSELRRNRLYAGFPDVHLDALIDTMAALVAHARRIDGEAQQGQRTPLPGPFFNVRQQVWIRELARMVASVALEPRLRHYDDLGLDEQRHSLPLVHCRSCGGAGWTTVAPNDNRRPITAEPRAVYEAYFGYSERLRFIFREAPAPNIKKGPPGQTLPGWLCPTCLTVHQGEARPENGCSSCRGEAEALFEVFVHKPGKMTPEKFRIDHDCPFCGSSSGMGILGARSVTLVSGMVGTIFGSDFNDDPKLLTFSDSVQDAAHRASVFQARNATNVFRAGLSRFVCEAVDPSFGDVMQQAPLAMRTPKGVPTFSAADFVATYLPADMEWRRDYAELLETDALPKDSKLPDYLEERLSWETFAELTFRSRLGATVERLGLTALHVKMEAALAAADELLDRIQDELNIERELIQPNVLLRFVLGLLDHMRARGAVANDITRLFVEREANWYAVWRSYKNGNSSLPNYAPASPKPCFPANRSLAGFESFAAESSGGWYVAWFHKSFDHVLTLTGELSREFYSLLFTVLERHEIVERLPIKSKDSASAAWGIQPSLLKVSASVGRVRCSACGNQHVIPGDYVAQWAGMNCTRVGCLGLLQESEIPLRVSARLLTEGRIKRVIAAEHTSLLDREKRLAIEERFMSKTPKTWYPNLLAATPTLELGINIGDLSTLVLCSVPPEQANYVQRIGRTGRRDGNSLNITVAMARPHDMWFWTEPKEMIAGTVKTPGVHLKAVAILRRQFAAYTLDCWVAEQGANIKRYGRVGDALRASRSGQRNMFPLFWYDFIAKNATRLFEGFAALFPMLRDDPESLEILRGFAHGGESDGLAHLVATEFKDLENELESIQRRIDDSKVVTDKLKAEVPPPTDLKERLDDLAREKRALGRIRDTIRRSDTLGFLTDRGILPNYAFPEQGVTLRSILYRSDAENEQEREPLITDYVRSASSALTEFAPSSSFYAEGRKLKIDQVDLSASPIDHWRICPDCTHIAVAVGEMTDTPCPSCGSVMWSDKGSRRPMIRLKQVLAVAQERNTRIGDDGDDRDRKYFDRDYLPAFERDQVGDAFAIDDGVLPFGFEHLRRCTFRDVNFGETGEAATGQKIAGERRHGHGFKLCRTCGKVQDRDELRRKPKEKRKLGLHLPRCSEVASEDEETYVSVVYLFREFSSEAIRFLLPLASSGDEDAVKSMRAAIDLGLRLHFKGKVDHLHSSLVETKEGPLTRRYLYLYDTVPGGTGYLKQLASRPDELKSVFSQALTHMLQCSCNGDQAKDGCPRCIRSHSSTFGRGEVSRDTACRLLGEIIGSWDKLRRIETVSEIKLNKALESELEGMFIERLRMAIRSEGGKLNKTVVGGRPGYFVKLATGEWHLEPQVELHRKFAKMPATRADFVFWPAVPVPDKRPVAIYLDGWQWHADRISDDLALRQKLMRSGSVLVWSLTWDDVTASPSEEKKKHYWDPIASLPFELMDKLKDGSAAASDLAPVLAENAFGHLLRLLRGPSRPIWDGFASAAATGLFLKGMAAGQDRKQALVEIDKMAGVGGADTIEAVLPTATLGIVKTGGVGLVVVAVDKQWLPPAWPHPSMLTVAIGFEHQLGISTEAKRAWNGTLRLLNILQFLPWLFVGCRDGIPLSPSIRPTAPDEDDGWTDIERLVLGDMLPLVGRLKLQKVSLPEVLFEASSPDGEVMGTLELAWPAQKIGVVLDPALVPFFKDWKVIVYVGNDEDVVSALGASYEHA